MDFNDILLGLVGAGCDQTARAIGVCVFVCASAARLADPCHPTQLATHAPNNNKHTHADDGPLQARQPAAAAAPVAGDDDATDDENTGKVALKAPVVDPDSILYSVEWLGEGGEPSGVRATLRRPRAAC